MEINEVVNKVVNKVVNDNGDSLEIGTPAKGGAVKIYGSFDRPDEFKAKVDAAKVVRDYAQSQITLNI